MSKTIEVTKPDWITDKEWEINPNIYHWEQSRKAMQFVEQSKPITREKAEEMMAKRYESLGLSRQHYEDLLK